MTERLPANPSGMTTTNTAKVELMIKDGKITQVDYEEYDS